MIGEAGGCEMDGSEVFGVHCYIMVHFLEIKKPEVCIINMPMTS
jgi:hypothetical protein